MNYIGSKLTLTNFLSDSILDIAGDNISGCTFADLFAGTGAVGTAFKEKGCRVIANDIQYYSYVLNRHLVGNVPPLDVSEFDYMFGLEGADGFVYNNYCEGSGSGRNYFADENGRKCDAIRIELEGLKKENKIDERQYYYILASLINSIDKYANTASVYGAYLKHIKNSAQKEFKFELLPVIEGSDKCEVYNRDVNELIGEISGDILYLDPPYNARQYCANYHVLETIARYDNPILKGVTGLRDYTEQRSLYCSKRTVERVFDDLIKRADFKYIFLSYNNEGLMSFDTIKSIMSQYGKYDVRQCDYRRFKADRDENRNHKSDSTTEYLHCLTK